MRRDRDSEDHDRPNRATMNEHAKQVGADTQHAEKTKERATRANAADFFDTAAGRTPLPDTLSTARIEERKAEYHKKTSQGHVSATHPGACLRDHNGMVVTS